MSDPLGLLPLAVASGGGHVDGYETQQLVAAGLTLLQRSAPLVRALQRRRAAILLPTSPAFVTALAAAEGRGAVLINPLAAPAEVAYQISDAGVGAVFTNTALAAKLPGDVARVLLDESPRTARVLVDGRSRDVDLGSHVGLSIEGDTDAPGAEEEAAVVYTSAMAGWPLGAILTHRNLLSNARATVQAGALTRDDHGLAVLPFAHLFGLVVAGAATLLPGGRVTTVDRFNPVRAIESIETQGVTVLVAVPAVFAALTALLERRGVPLRSDALRLCICGGAPLAVELQQRWCEVTRVELRQGYGLTEAGPVCLFNRVGRPNRRGTLGTPFPGVRVSIREPDGAGESPVGVEGEICIAGPNVSPGYVASAAPRGAGEGPWADGLRRDGEWLRSGDLGVRNADDTVRFLRFRKPMFTRNGFNVYPREIERVVAEMPGARGARVRAIPDPLRENDIALAVEGDVTEADVRRWCEARLSVYKQPMRITINDAAS